MSEYQYYEWQCIDRSLTAAEQTAVDGLSSHIHVTSSSAQVDYSWSSFKHNPAKVLADYFDAFLYLANWGDQQLMFRFPKALLDPQQVRPYLVDYHIELDDYGEVYILKFSLTEEDPPDEWIDGGGKLSTLARLRDDILQGDYRVLYLAWLRATELDYDLDEEAIEPPVPPGLFELTPALGTFIDFFEIDSRLVKAAAHASPSMAQPPSAAEYQTALSGLSRRECERFLVRLLAGEPNLVIELRKMLKPLIDESEPVVALSSTGRTVGTIHAIRDQLEEAERKRQQAEAEVKRLRELEALATRKEETWQQAERLIEQGNRKSYREAVDLLNALSDLAIHQGDEARFETRLAELRARYHRRRSLIEMLQHTGSVDYH